MGWQFTPYVLSMFLAAGAAFVAAALIWRSRSVGSSRRLVGLLLAVGWWALLAGLGLLRTDLAGKTALYSAMFLGVTLTPVVWLLFVVDYVGQDEWVTRRRLGALLVVPVVTLLAVATNEPMGGHELFWRNPSLDTGGALVTLSTAHGPWFWVHSVYSYALLGIGMIYLLGLVLFSDRIYQVQAASLVFAVVVPILANLAFLANVGPDWLDLTSPAFVVSALVLAVTIYRHRLLTAVPAAHQLARSELVETTPDPVLVVSDDRDVLDLNPASVSLFDVSQSDVIGRPLGRLSPDLDAALSGMDQAGQTELAIEDGAGTRYFDVQVAPLSAGYGVVVGRLLSLRDVTDRRRRQQRLSVLNRLLRHDLRNVMTTIRGNAEFVNANSDNEAVARRMDVIERNVDTIVRRRDKFDSVLRSLDVETEPVEVVELTRAVVENARERSSVDVTLDAPTDCWIDSHTIVQVPIEELVENAIEHTDQEVRITITLAEDVVEIVVADDGPGIPAHEIEPLESGRETPLEHSTGLGLWVVKWIVEALDGAIDFETDDGTQVTLYLPRAAYET